jgi:MFS family permease
MSDERQSEEQTLPGSVPFLLLLTLLNVMNFVDRQLLSSFANFIVPDLNLTNTEFGLLTGLVFLFFYSTMGIFMGVLADRVNRTRLIAIGLASWSVLTALSGAAKGFISLAIPRMFIGVGESMMTPSAMSILADRFPASRLGFASGVYYMGVPIGTGVSLLIVGYLGPSWGWRNCFYMLGALGVVMAIVMWFIKETPRRHLATAEQMVKSAPSMKEIAATVMQTLPRSPALMLTIGGGVAYHFILGATVFDQLWFVQERGFDRAVIAQYAGWIGISGGILGNLFGGIGSDWFTRRTGLGRPMFLFWIMLILAPLNIAYRLVDPGSSWFWIGLFCGYFQLGAFYGPTFSTIQELVPPQVRATVVAFYILLLNLIGVGFGVTFAGIAIDQLIAQGIEQPYTIALLGFTMVSFICIPCFLIAGKRFKRDKAQLYENLAQ